MNVRGSILRPKLDGSVDFIPDGLILSDEKNWIAWIGAASDFHEALPHDLQQIDGVILPPFIDAHIHIPQHPIRGHFLDGVAANPPEGRLLAGLNRNVFPIEQRCVDPDYTRQCVRDFQADTLAKGVVGGAAYMTVHTSAARIALEILPATWSVGLVMMNQNCPEYLRTDEANFERDARSLARDFGERYIVTDRFAVACDTELRCRGVNIAKQFGLRMQTHLNEQRWEKAFVENVLYPGENYTGVYQRDGLLDHRAILAHCIHMSDAELQMLVGHHSCIAHCPTSNTLLGSGIMPLDRIVDCGIDYAICTDVGASPTTSLLNEMAQFLKVHAGRSKHATPSEALFRTTLGAARMLGHHDHFGSLQVGKPMSFVEVRCNREILESCISAGDVIARAMLETSELSSVMQASIDRLENAEVDAGPTIEVLTRDVAETAKRLDDKICRVVIDGTIKYERVL